MKNNVQEQGSGLALDGIHPLPTDNAPVLAGPARVEVVELNTHAEYVVVLLPQKWLKCPITKLFSASPVLTQTADLYDEAAIRALIAHGGVDPKVVDPATLVKDNFRKSINDAIAAFNPNYDPTKDESDIRLMTPVNNDDALTVKIKLSVGILEDTFSLNYLPVPFTTTTGGIYEESWIRQYLISNGNKDPQGALVVPQQLYLDRFRQAIYFAMFKANPRFILESVDDKKVVESVNYAIQENDAELLNILLAHFDEDEKEELDFSALARDAVARGSAETLNILLAQLGGDEKARLIRALVRDAVAQGSAETLRILLGQLDEDQKTALDMVALVGDAAAHDNAEMLNVLVESLTDEQRKDLSPEVLVRLAISQKNPAASLKILVGLTGEHKDQLSKILVGLTRKQRDDMNIRQLIDEAFQSRNEEMFIAFMKNCGDTVHLGDEAIATILGTVVEEGRVEWAREILAYYQASNLRLLREVVAPLNAEMAIALYATPEIRRKLRADKSESALALACRNEDEVIIQHCLNNPQGSLTGVDENALSVALSLGNAKVINLLLAQDPAKLNSQVLGGDTPVMKAILLPALNPLVGEMVKAPNFNWELKNQKTDSVFHVACYTGNEMALNTLLQTVPPAHKHLFTDLNNAFQTPLSIAVKDHHACAVRLIAEGAGVFTQVIHEGQKVTPLALTRVLKRKNLEAALTQYYESHMGDICDLLITRDYQCVNPSDKTLILPVVNEWLPFKAKFFEYLSAVHVNGESSAEEVDRAELICSQLSNANSPVRQFFELGQRTWGIWSSPWPAKFKALTEVLRVEVEVANQFVTSDYE